MPKVKYANNRCKRVKDFIKEINQICQKHQLSISHEDQQGGFEITDYDECFTVWFSMAGDKTREPKEKI